MITDGLDGFLARRYDMKSKVGVFLDPVMDKFFVIFIVVTFINEGSLGIYEALALICRDFSVVIFGIYLSFAGKLTSYRFRSIWCGKATTFLQFFALLGLTFGLAIPSFFYTVFIILGLLALAELYIPLTSRNT
jgi:phosphatidylglycerophosphate synthase